MDELKTRSVQMTTFCVRIYETCFSLNYRNTSLSKFAN